MKGLECIQGGKALHLYQLWFQLPFFIFADAKIEYNKLRMAVLVRHFYIGRYATVGEFNKFWVNDHVNNIFAGTQHFFCKIFGNKNRCFCIPEIQ